jgi:hypothetical protein
MERYTSGGNSIHWAFRRGYALWREESRDDHLRKQFISSQQSCWQLLPMMLFLKLSIALGAGLVMLALL